MVARRRPCESTRQRILSFFIRWFLDSDDDEVKVDINNEDKNEDTSHRVEGGTIRSCITSFIVVLVGGIAMLYSIGEDPMELVMSLSEYRQVLRGAEWASFSALIILSAFTIATLTLLWQENRLAKPNSWSLPLWSTKDLHGEPLEEGVCGLYNLGNSCYMSASIQCLNAVPPLREIVRHDDCLRWVNEDNRFGTGGRVVRQFKSLLDRMWGGDILVAAPTAFKTEMGRLEPDFAGRRQQDAQEFMSWLLDKLHEDMNTAHRGAAPLRARGPSFDNLTDEQRSRRSHEEYMSQNRSPIDRIFNGQEASVLHCLKCNRHSANFSAQKLVPIRIPSPLIWLEPLLVPVTGKALKLGFWISKNAAMSELANKICALASGAGTTVNGPLEADQLSFSSTDPDGLHVRRRIIDDWCIKDIDLRLPLWAVQTPLVRPDSEIEAVASNDRSLKKQSDETKMRQESMDFQEVDQSFLIKIVQRTAHENEYELIGNASLLRVHAKASSKAVARAVCMICVRSCPDLFASNSDQSTAIDETWEKMLDCATIRYTSCTERSQISGISPDFSLVPLHDNPPVSSWMTKYTTLCFDWHPPVSELVIDANGKTQISFHSSYISAYEADCSRTDDLFQGKEESVSLKTCLDEHTSPESVCDMSCEKCGGRTHTKTLSFSMLPPVLMISLKRFENIQRKNCTLVEFPLRDFDMSPWLHSDNNGESTAEYLYDLVAVLNHKGQLSYGHYTAFGLTKSGSWALFDDDVCTLIDEADLQDENVIITNKAYVLVYVRKGWEGLGRDIK